MDAPLFVTGPELRKLLSLSRTTYSRLLDRGLPCLGSGKLRRHSLEEVIAWYEDTLGTNHEPDDTEGS